ncbi:hypothetical protein WAC35_29175, partial [Klebsiella pneumoniae]|uniref:hypothetical protein n=1 Tax=Klebsiella pneumoniae TaxID=573 RepID=UPI0030130105
LERVPFDNAEALLSSDTVIFTPFLSMSVDAVLVHLLCLMRSFETLIEKETPSGAESNEGVKLIIIDEANRLKHQSFEHI